ncbi:MAG: multifunctional CCA tRNA nucleotidyl transferase/2'3'-cyclic phosphodiesterase/2'nucleotidase/phosphatase [Betaproteobacteria bacterium]|nr:multifunctional CCA tRNA nucleotidyl transferase/2'3'-cyclic phosphodiesterase/2'nucleotidase/phosphatase [Betaproteobacteria bacterium]
MKIYRVGGAVRDELLGREVQDRDYVVVGATPEQMIELGYEPVGKDFPVFLHPRTHEEHALARTERKSGRGYKGFSVHASPDVTLEEDLARRDLTINAMARGEAGELIDPYGGRRDLAAGVLRHVSPAFVEDPVRILRVARFAARFGFTVAEETLVLMRHMVDTGEADHLVPERVWQEISRGLLEDRPSVMFEILAECGALARIAASWSALLDPRRERGREILNLLDLAADQRGPLTVRFALAAHPLGPALPALCASLRVPNDCSELAGLCTRHLASARLADRLDAESIVSLLYGADAFRRPGRFFEMVWVAAVEDGKKPASFRPDAALRRALTLAQTVDAQSVARRHGGQDIAAHLRRARVDAVKAGTR